MVIGNLEKTEGAPTRLDHVRSDHFEEAQRRFTEKESIVQRGRACTMKWNINRKMINGDLTNAQLKRESSTLTAHP